MDINLLVGIAVAFFAIIITVWFATRGKPEGPSNGKLFCDLVWEKRGLGTCSCLF